MTKRPTESSAMFSRRYLKSRYCQKCGKDTEETGEKLYEVEVGTKITTGLGRERGVKVPDNLLMCNDCKEL